MPQNANSIAASPRPTVMRKLLAALLYPFNSEKRKIFRAGGGGYYEGIRRGLIVGIRNIGAVIRHPLSSKKRKQLRERKPYQSSRMTRFRKGNRTDSVYRDVYQQYADTATFVPTNEFGAIALKRPPTERCDAKLIAYYLPQFHPIPENDRNWGKGFTEWRNVTKAVPSFVGHYQPRQPGELGFYDLRVVDIMQRQVELAKLYGISAFCFHFYWFGGKRLLELPLQNYLHNQDLELPFCLCWANENWSRRWDGSENEILVAQAHSPEDDIAFIRYLKQYFDDPRYLKVDGKPMLTVYRPGILPNMKETVARWRSEMSKMGFPGIFLIATNSFSFEDYESGGFDALSEFPPHGLRVPEISDRVEPLGTTNAIFDYESVVERYEKESITPGKVVMPGIMPGWDNSARRPFAGYVFHGSTPALFERWLDASVKRSKQNPSGQRMVIINAWNEWAEGAYLEPDRRFGYAYLSACSSVVREHATKDRFAADILRKQRARFRKNSDKAVALHLFYEDLAPAIAEQIAKFGKTDFFITVSDDISRESAETLARIFPDAFIQETKNLGRDIRPFLSILQELLRHEYKFICKLHTKKSSQMDAGHVWRDSLISSLLGDEASRALAGLERKPRIGMLAPRNSVMSLSDPFVRRNTEEKLRQLTKRIETRFDIKEKFVAGSMFWFRPDALRPLATLYGSGIEFEPELGQIDGTTAHAIERLFAIVAKSQGFELEEFGERTSNPYQ